MLVALRARLTVVGKGRGSILRLLCLAPVLFTASIASGQPLLGAGDMLETSALELQRVEEVNRAYSDAYQQPRENNWVLEKIAAGTMMRGCWLDEETFFPVGAKQVFDGMAMQCIEVGKSSRLFWPLRWIEFCRQRGLDYATCMLTRIDADQ